MRSFSFFCRALEWIYIESIRYFLMKIQSLLSFNVPPLTFLNFQAQDAVFLVLSFSSDFFACTIYLCSDYQTITKIAAPMIFHKYDVLHKSFILSFPKLSNASIIVLRYFLLMAPPKCDQLRFYPVLHLQIIKVSQILFIFGKDGALYGS